MLNVLNVARLLPIAIIAVAVALLPPQGVIVTLCIALTLCWLACLEFFLREGGRTEWLKDRSDEQTKALRYLNKKLAQVDERLSTELSGLSKQSSGSTDSESKTTGSGTTSQDSDDSATQ